MEVSGQLHAPVALLPAKALPIPIGESGYGFEKKNFQPRRKSNPDHQIVQSVASHYSDWAILALIYLHLPTKNYLVLLYQYYVGQWPLSEVFGIWLRRLYKSVSKSFPTGRLERELQIVQLSATRYSLSLFCESA
jgi:hypothetical protein